MTLWGEPDPGSREESRWDLGRSHGNSKWDELKS